MVGKSMEEKAAVIEKCKASGLTQQVWCKENNVSYSTLKLWITQYNRFLNSQTNKYNGNDMSFIELF